VQNNETGTEETVPVDGIFVAIGHKPNTSLEKQIEVDEMGYVVVNPEPLKRVTCAYLACGTYRTVSASDYGGGYRLYGGVR